MIRLIISITSHQSSCIRRFRTCAAGLLLAALLSPSQARAFVDDGDGLLDVGEAPGFPADPAAATGGLTLDRRSIQDLDGTNLLTNLQSLGLEYNEVTSIETGDFGGLNNLQWLNLEHNKLTSIESGGFIGLTNLQGVNLDYNELASIELDDFSGLTNLLSLKVRENELTSIELGSFSGLTSLKWIELYGNHLTSIESGNFSALSNLEAIDLEYNELTSVESGDFSGLPNLRWLILSRNQITSIESGALAGLTELRGLYLDTNDLNELDLTQATLHNLIQLFIDSAEIATLRLDDAELSQESWETILGETTEVIDASLVGLSFADSSPSDLSSLLSISTLDNVRVDPALYSLYAAELDAFDAIEGNTVTVVPEPSALVLMLAGACWLFYRHKYNFAGGRH